VHVNLVVPAVEVELREEGGAVEFVEQLVDDWNREHVPNCGAVEGTVVHAEVPRAVLLPNQQHRGGERRCTRPDNALSKHVGALPFDLIFEELRVTIWPHGNWRRPGQ